ncbi:MAG: polysaccharide deacetylase family protein [Polaribacter sp.]|uniref:polysaccharide deacetylase family protein n=1 Tax=Polaribacter sp. TaxID=1920175 RepID=UPI002F355CB9
MNAFFENLLIKLISKSNQRILLPFYHKITDEENTFTKHLYPPRKINDFKADLRVLQKYYKQISVQEFSRISKSKKKITKNYFHLSFDDGLSNFYKVAAPILLENNISATLFVNSDFVDNKALFYRYKASLLYQFYEESSKKEKNKFYDFFDKKKNIRESLFSINFNNKALLDDIANAIDYSFEEYLEREKPYLSSLQIEELIEMGFTIGAHSKNHPLYTDISFEEQINQTTDSINWLVEKFNIDYKLFAFPFTDLGVSNTFFEELSKEQIIDVSFGTAGIKKDSFETNFQRLTFEIGSQNGESYLLKEYIKYFLKRPLKKNTMPRY